MTSRMRIAIFVGEFPVPSETFILRQVTGLIDLGHEVHIYANARSDSQSVHEVVHTYGLLGRTTYIDGPPESVIWEMPVTPLRERTWIPGTEQSIHNFSRAVKAFPRLLLCSLRSPSLTRSLLTQSEYAYRARSLSGVYRLASLLKFKMEYDVLHAHFGPVANSFRFARCLCQAPLVVSFHGYDFSTVPRKEGRNVYDRLFATADVVTANSDYTRKQLEALGCGPHKLVKLPVGLNVDEFSYQPRRLVPGQPLRLLTVARLVEIKGHEYVIQAVAKVREKFGNLRYDIVGDGPQRKGLARLVESLQLKDIVHLHGARSETEVKRFMAEAHVFILGSVTIDGDREGQGLVLQEAQACGLPVIATHHGAFSEGIAPENDSWLTPERDVEAMAAQLHRLISAESQWPSIGADGRRFVEMRYDIRELNQQLVAIYRKAMSSFISAR